MKPFKILDKAYKSRRIDRLGVMHHFGLVPEKYLKEYMATPIAKCFLICKKYIKYTRTIKKQEGHLGKMVDLGNHCLQLKPQYRSGWLAKNENIDLIKYHMII